MLMRRPLPVAILLILLAPFVTRAQSTAGTLAILVAADNTSKNTTASIVEITTTGVNQTGVPTTGIGPLRFSGSATSNAYLANSNDGTLLCITGANTTAGTVSN